MMAHTSGCHNSVVVLNPVSGFNGRREAGIRARKMITQLRLRNFRGFDRHTVPLRPITILVGKNNAGKSTVVEALRLVSMVTNRCKSLTYHALPKWLDRPRRERGVFPAIEGSEFSNEAVFHRLGEPPAHITAHFQTGETVEACVGPDLAVVGI